MPIIIGVLFDNDKKSFNVLLSYYISLINFKIYIVPYIQPNSIVVVRGPGYGHRPAYTAPHLNPCVGAPPGQVPAECFRGATSSQGLSSPRRVSFANDATVLGDAPPLVHSTLFCMSRFVL